VSKAFIPAAKPIVGDDEWRAVGRVLTSGMLAQGPEVRAFEDEFAQQMVSGRVCVAVNSGSSGLHLGLLAAGIGPNDEVIVPSFTFVATANSIALTGAKPVFADIEADYFCLNPQSVRNAITERTRAIMPVHLYGHPANMPVLMEIANERGLELFEDAAQAHGASLGGAKVGTFGAFGMFSLHPTKNMTSGEGAMVSCETAELARRIRLLRNQGMERPYANTLVGLNNRMSDIHAAIGRVQLAKIGAWTRKRQENAAFLHAHLQGVKVPPVAAGAVHVYHRYTIRIPGASSSERDRVVTALREEHGIESGVYYPVPSHRLISMARYGPGPELPATERAAAEVISLPVHPSLDERDLDRVVTAVNVVVAAGS
jgi:perosamine synthetase